MPNFTAKLGLTKPLTTEAYDIAIPNANMDILDAAPANVTVCTSSTRPSTPHDGDLIYETDSTNLLVRQSGAWRAANMKVQICTSSTRPSSSLSFGGMIIFETDTLALVVRNAANSAWLTPYNPPNIQKFTASGTWAKPAGLVAIMVEVIGGGGSGGGTAATGVSQVAGSGGGGAGSYARKIIAGTTLAATEGVTVGAGGAAATAGNNAGNNGADSVFATGRAYIVTAGGGVGGSGGFVASAGSISGGAGGTATGGDVNIPGGDGGCATIPSATVLLGTAYGGAPPLGASARSLTATGTGNGGKSYGGGSSGSGNFIASQGAKASAAGADGIVIITHYF